MRLHRRLLLLPVVVLLYATMGGGAAWGQWSRTPQPRGGFAASLFSGSGYLLVGLENGGVYRSTDDGNSWEFASTGLPGYSCGGYAFARLGSHVFVSSGSTVCVSTDDGISWSVSSNGLPVLGGRINDILVRDTKLFCVGNGSGVCRSLDTGATWVTMSSGLTQSSGNVLLGTSQYIYVGLQDSGVFRSSDDGQNWLPASVGLSTSNARRILGLDAMGTDTLVAATREGAYYSMDGGGTWTIAASGLNNQTASIVFASGTDFFAGTYGSGAYRSTNGGVDWVLSQTNWTGGNVRAFCVHDGILFGGNYGYPVVYKSTDNGSSWVFAGNGISSELTYALGTDTSRIFAATTQGICMTTDHGTTWTWPSLLQAHAFYSVYAGGGLIYAGSSALGPYVSTDNGATWDTASSGLSGSGMTVTSMAADNVFTYAGTNGGVYRSSDNGALWTTARTGLSDTLVVSLCFARGKLFAGTHKGMFVSTDSGSSWNADTNGLPRYPITSIVALDTVLVVACQYSPNAYKSTDGGASWYSADAGLSATGAVVQCLAAVDGYLFAGTTAQGVWASTNRGENWTDFSDGEEGPGLNVAGLASEGGYLYAAAQGGGIWIRPVAEAVSVDRNQQTGVQAVFSLSQNYPNPFNPTTVISGQWTADSWAKLVVYDVLGRKVATLADGRYPAGRHSFVFKAKNLASGVYFYRLTAGPYSSARKMILTR